MKLESVIEVYAGETSLHWCPDCQKTWLCSETTCKIDLLSVSLCNACSFEIGVSLKRSTIDVAHAVHVYPEREERAHSFARDAVNCVCGAFAECAECGLPYGTCGHSFSAPLIRHRQAS